MHNSLSLALPNRSIDSTMYRHDCRLWRFLLVFGHYRLIPADGDWLKKLGSVEIPRAAVMRLRPFLSSLLIIRDAWMQGKFVT